MRRSRLIAILLSLSLFLSLSFASLAQQTTPTVTSAATQQQSGATYTVQPGDNLFRIALRFKSTTAALATANGIVNPSLIFVGQVLKIPGQQATPAVTPAVTPAPTASPPAVGTTTYIVAPGDTLFRIAMSHNTTVAKLLELNAIPNANLIYVGQKLTVAGSAVSVTPTARATTATTTTTATVSTTETVLPPASFDYGIEVFETATDANTLLAQVSQLGMHWVKLTVNWKDYEPVQGQIDLSGLDPVVNALSGQGVKILLTVTTSPTWARTSTTENGPPDDFAHFATFVGALATRYQGKVNAYEVWNEPNLRREWNSKVYPIRADHYMTLLSAARDAIKAADPNAQVISAGLAPTGFNDGVNAINDRVFLQDMYSNKLKDVADAVGAHPGGWANPPDATCCNQPEGVQTHFNDRSFFFKDTLSDYRQIMTRNGDGGRAIWVTKFGWGTSEDTDPPSQSNVFLTYTSLAEQATYIPEGFEVAEQLGFVGPMFLYNLNGCQIDPREACYYSLISLQGSPRPAFNAVAALEKAGAPGEASIGSSTETPTLGSDTSSTATTTIGGESTPEAGETGPQVTPEATAQS